MIGATVQSGSRPAAARSSTRSTNGSPAEDAGLEKGDVVIALDGRAITDGSTLIVAIRSHQPGDRSP